VHVAASAGTGVGFANAGTARRRVKRRLVGFILTGVFFMGEEV
jgi:hypothetical protein